MNSQSRAIIFPVDSRLFSTPLKGNPDGGRRHASCPNPALVTPSSRWLLMSSLSLELGLCRTFHKLLASLQRKDTRKTGPACISQVVSPPWPHPVPALVQAARTVGCRLRAPSAGSGPRSPHQRQLPLPRSHSPQPLPPSSLWGCSKERSGWSHPALPGTGLPTGPQGPVGQCELCT